MFDLILRKMQSSWQAAKPVQYSLVHDELRLELNEKIGRRISLIYQGQISCTACGRSTKKSYQQGYCFPCTQKLASCDLCIVKPELCHYHRGTCREPEWGQSHCMIPHTLYAANSSGLKIGITRSPQRITRWIDQGATQAIAVTQVKKRLDAGLLEVILKQDFADKTNWRDMLRGTAQPLDLEAIREDILGLLPMTVDHQPSDDASLEILYPVVSYPTKIQSHNFDKNPRLEGTLLGIKGQYLILDTAVINIRSYTGYHVRFES